MLKIGIVGSKNCGKTTLIEKLLPLLTEQHIRVATIKHTAHRHSFDTEGKDSWRHRQAGAGLTLAISEGEIAMFAPLDEELLRMTDKLMAAQFDLCLVEGDKQAGHPKILVTVNTESPPPSNLENVIASCGSLQHASDKPHFAAGETEALAAFISQIYHQTTQGVK